DPAGEGRDSDRDPEETIRRVVRGCYAIMRDDGELRKVNAMPPEERPGYFIGLRNNYPLRREFPATSVVRSDSPSFPAAELSNIGFRLV
ncbi:MAG TPA: DUF3410 domain-containing protein, partial [Bacteroidota bacterium]|nr:DUF3410 domain-containing protein [Bacteroidota bacterium]